MKLSFLFIISVITINSICAYPNNKQLHTINLVKRANVATNYTNAIEKAKYLRQEAINKYSNYKDLNSTSSEITKISSIIAKGTLPNIASLSNGAISGNILSKSEEGQCTLYIKDINQDVDYYAEIIVGNQRFSILLDTGSSNLWIPNKNCTSASCQNHNRFDSNKSPTFKSEGNQWSILYGTGSASGVTGIDDIKIGKFTANSQTFGLADAVSDDFLPLQPDGILGMAFDNLNTMDNGAPTLISTLIKQKKMNPLFSFHFQHYYDFDDQGTLTLGGVDESKFDGKITYNPVISEIGLWIIVLDEALVNNNSTLSAVRPAIIDTGNSLLIVPLNDAAEIHKQIPGSEFDSQGNVYIIPCDTTAVVSLVFGGVEYKIPPRDLIAFPMSDNQCQNMKIYFITIFSTENEESVNLTGEYELTGFGFFQRGSVQEFMKFFSKTVAERTRPGQRLSVEENTEGLAGVIICDNEYLQRIALSLLNPKEADQIINVQEQLDETRQFMNKTIESLLQCGEKLDELFDRSQEISFQSKAFYKQARK
ncbi:37053_t:CDS:2, partial [Gigaspora margarita]